MVPRRRAVNAQTIAVARMRPARYPAPSMKDLTPRAPQLLLVVSMLACLGCGRYEIQGDGHGKLVRLDRLTGEMAYLQGRRLVRVENPGDRRRALQELAVARDWGSKAYDGYTLRLRTSWRTGRMYYQIGIAPIPPANVFNFRIALLDRQGFEVAGISLNVPDGVADSTSITYTGVTIADEDSYREAQTWSPRVELYRGGPPSAEELPLP
jgi:hypothetical protein